MDIWGDGEPAAFALGIIHHFGDVDMPVGSLLRMVHAVSTFAVPAFVTLASCAAAFFAARPRPETTSATPPAVYAFASSDNPPARDRQGDERATRPVDRFYRVTFGDERAFRLWAERVVEFAAALQDVVPDLREIRPVIFVQLRPSRDAPPYAYVSAGARGLATHISGGTKVDASPVSMSELPNGLTMLYGEGVDADAYQHRGEREA
jgi:hypothetical protein